MHLAAAQRPPLLNLYFFLDKKRRSKGENTSVGVESAAYILQSAYIILCYGRFI